MIDVRSLATATFDAVMGHPRLASLVALLLAVALEAQNEHTAPTQGFRIERPDTTWVFHQSTPAGGGYKLDVVMKATPGVGAGSVAASVQVATAGAEDTAEKLQQAAIARVRGRKEYAEVIARRERVAGIDTPAVSVRYTDKDGREWRIEQHYLIEDGRRYVLQAHAPADAFAAHAAAFRAMRASFALMPITAEAKAARRLEALAARCGSEAGWTKGWPDAVARAKAEDRPILVVVRAYEGFDLSDGLATHTFMDADVLDLVQTRFVPWRWQKGMPAPFVDHAVYGMSGTTFGQALLVVDVGGRVLAETAAVQPVPAFTFLLDALQRHGGPVPELTGTPIERAAAHVRRGEFAAAKALLGDATSAAAWLIRATLARKQRDGKVALTALAAARGADPDGPLTNTIALEEAVVLLRLGRRDDAVRVLDGLLAAAPHTPERPAAMYWRGVCDARLRDQAATRARWADLMEEYPDSRWAAQAAGMLRDTLFDLGAPIETRWPDEALLASLRFADAEHLTAAQSAQARNDAVAELLATQRLDGTWISPSELGMGASGLNPFVEAITALAGRGLLAERANPEVARALEGALGYLLAAQARARARTPERVYMDYTVWSHAFALWFYADCVQAGVGDADALRAAMAERLADLGTRQAEGGGFSYYLTRSAGDAPAVAQQSISFVTAPAVLAMLRVRQVGVDLPDAMLDRAVACLARMRQADGLFEYMLANGAERPTRRLAPDGAAGRSPVCELALFEAGSSSRVRLERALALFVEHRSALAGQLGKALMHAGADGQGCHYVLFDYAFAAAAWKALAAPPGDGPQANPRPDGARTMVLDLLLAARRKGGGFEDTTINGRAFGTAAALQALRDLGAGSD